MTTTIRRTTQLLFFATIVSIALVYRTYYTLWHALAIAMLGVFWYRLGNALSGVADYGFVGCSLLIANMVFRNGIDIWGILAIHSTLAMWDLMSFTLRLPAKDFTDASETVARHHLQRLIYVLAISLSLSLASFYLNFNLPLLGILISGLVAVFALAKVIQFLRRNTA